MKQNADTNERTCKFQCIRIDRKECMHHVREPHSHMILTGGISCTPTENQNQVSCYPFALHEISVLIELTLEHLRYHLTDVPPQPNSQPDSVFGTDRPANEALMPESEL